MDGDTPKTLSLYERRGNGLVLPFGTLRAVLPYLPDKTALRSGFAPPVKVEYSTDVPLYDYQETAVRAMLAARYGILQSAAGSGKTQMGLALAARLGRRTLWLCHTLDLIRQSRERAEQYIPRALLGTVTGGRVNLGEGITFATVQTMSRLNLEQYRDYWDCIIVDEVHRVSGSPTAVTRYQRVLSSLSARHKYGLSATVHRADGMIRAAYALVGEVAYRVPDEAVADRIMRVGIRPVGTGTLPGREALNPDGTLHYTGLVTYLTEQAERNALIVRSIEENKGKPSLVLSDRLDHLSRLMRLLPPEMARDAVMIDGKATAKKDKAAREKAIEDMRQGRKTYLFATYSLAREGLDIPCLERLYLTTPKKDYAVVTQSIGRIARTCEGKNAPVCYDFVDSGEYLLRCFKRRCAVYRKNGCYFTEEKR